MRIAAAALFVLLPACAANELRVERANSVSPQAKATTTAAHSYVADVQAHRREAALALVASDPSCLWGPRLTVGSIWDGSKPLCDLSGVPALRRITLNLQPISAQGLKAITTSIAGVTAYQEALAAILEEKPNDAKQAITTSIDMLTTAAGDVNRIAGDKLLDLTPLSSDRATAIVALIGALVAIQQTDLKVKKVRKIVDGTDSKALIASLDASAARLNLLQDGNAVTTRLAALNRAYSDEHARLSFGDHVTRLRELAATNDDLVLGGRVSLNTFRHALADLAKTDTALRQALEGNFSREERRKIARDNRKQLFSILSQVAAVFPAL